MTKKFGYYTPTLEKNEFSFLDAHVTMVLFYLIENITILDSYLCFGSYQNEMLTHSEGKNHTYSISKQ
jgi:hypothetical protein